MSFRLFVAPTIAGPQVRVRGLVSSPGIAPSACGDATQSFSPGPTDHPDTLLPRLGVRSSEWTEADVRSAQELVVKLEAILELVRAEERRTPLVDGLDAALHDLFGSNRTRARLQHGFEELR